MPIQKGLYYNACQKHLLDPTIPRERRILMPLVDKEKIRNYAMQKSMEMMQNPKVMKVMQNPKVMNAMMKAFEHRNKTKAKIDARVNKMAKSFNLVVQNEMTETNHSVRTLTNTVKELTETVEELQKQIKKSAPKKKKAEKPSK